MQPGNNISKPKPGYVPLVFKELSEDGTIFVLVKSKLLNLGDKTHNDLTLVLLSASFFTYLNLNQMSWQHKIACCCLGALDFCPGSLFMFVYWLSPAAQMVALWGIAWLLYL